VPLGFGSWPKDLFLLLARPNTHLFGCSRFSTPFFFCFCLFSFYGEPNYLNYLNDGRGHQNYTMQGSGIENLMSQLYTDVTYNAYVLPFVFLGTEANLYATQDLFRRPLFLVFKQLNRQRRETSDRHHPSLPRWFVYRRSFAGQRPFLLLPSVFPSSIRTLRFFVHQYEPASFLPVSGLMPFPFPVQGITCF